MLRLLVIGKNGYISRCFQKYIKRFEDIEVSTISVRDDTWENMDFSKFDAIYNTTGLAHDDARKGTVGQFMSLNRDLPVALAVKAKSEGVKTFVNMSSIIVYGEMSKLGAKELIKEETVPTPAGIYGKSKLEGEKELKKLDDDNFHVAIIRSPLVYSEDAVDNFLKLSDFAVRFPVFPKVNNVRSMIYSDNLCELVKLIVENNCTGTFYPQQDKYICTSKLVKDIAVASRHKMVFTKVFNPILYLMSNKIIFIRKVFGSLAYDMEMSDCFNGSYRVVKYDESINRVVRSRCKDK